MNGCLTVIALVGAAAMLILLILKLASFWQAFSEDTGFIRREMARAGSYTEYRRWRIVLRCRYLCLIPFVNEKNIIRIYRRIYCRNDPSQKEKQKHALMPLLLPSVLGICLCLCLACVCGITWAWYSVSTQAPVQKITAAYYQVAVDHVMNGKTKIASTNGAYKLTAETDYTVKLTAEGSVKECSGYCLIENTSGEAISYTQTFKPGESITIAFTPSADGIYTFIGIWGSLPAGTENYLKHTDFEDSGINESSPAESVSHTGDNQTPSTLPADDGSSEPAGHTAPAASETEPSSTGAITEPEACD